MISFISHIHHFSIYACLLACLFLFDLSPSSFMSCIFVNNATTRQNRLFMPANVDWKKLADKLPYGKDVDSKQKRKAMFRRLDPNGNGFLSLSEVDKGIVDIGLSSIIAKPVIIRAFNASKGDNTVCILSYFLFLSYFFLISFLFFLCFLSVFSFLCVFVRILRLRPVRTVLPAVEQRERRLRGTHGIPSASPVPASVSRALCYVR